MAKPKWRGTLTIGLVSVPVHLFATADKRSTVPVGHGVHRTCQTQATHKKWCGLCDTEVPEDELMRGYDVPPAQYEQMKLEAAAKNKSAPSSFVELTEDDIASVKVESTKVIQITSTAPLSQLEPLMIEQTSYLMSDGTALAAAAESVLVEAMRDSVGIGTLVLSGKERHVAVMVYGDGFLLHVLRTADQMRAFPERTPLPAPDMAMVGIAKQLIASMERPLDLSDTVDGYAEGVKQLIAEKCGAPVAAVAPRVESPKVASLMDALRASMAAVKAAPQMEAKVDGHRTVPKMKTEKKQRKAS